MKEIYRQGDIILEKVEAIPADVIPVDRKLEIKGETGHAHIMTGTVLKSPISPVEEYIEVGQGGALMIHPEHPTLPVPAGFYRIKRVRTFTPSKIIDATD